MLHHTILAMGIIKDGTVSGFLPNAAAFAVHYPGYPSSTDRAIETLGGIKGIAKAHCLQSNKLELHFRPEDPFSHPAFGELQPCNNSFLLRISKEKARENQDIENNDRISNNLSVERVNSERRSCDSDLIETEQVSQVCTTSNAAPSRKEEIYADIIAQVSEAYHFNGMVDYQHVFAVHANAAQRKKRSWAEVEPCLSQGVICRDVDQEDFMILVPPLFSLKDVPEKVVLKQCVDLSLKKKHEGVAQHRWEMDIEPCLAIDFNIKDVPRQVNWEKYVPQNSEQWEWHVAVCKLFDERPIWVKHSLAECLYDKGLKFGENVLRRLLFRTAYYFSNGPFLRFWIRKGYDPRKYEESRVYQRIDFRVPPSLRSYCDASITSRAKQRWQDICEFRVFPFKCQTSLQLIELGDEYIQQQIQKQSNKANCDCATGWYSLQEINCLRLRVAVRFLSVYPKAGAEILLKSASIRFERSKKMRTHSKESRLDDEIIVQDSREMVENDVKGLCDNIAEMVDNEVKELSDDEEGEEDEMEDYNIDEDMNAFEAYDLARDDESICSDPQSTSANISKNYLQQLFGSFPFAEGGSDELQNADDSDEEYQIYEQYSDEIYSEYDEDL